MAIIDDIKNRLGETVYPRTLLNAVYDSETNKSLDKILLEKELTVGNTEDFKASEKAGLKIEIQFGDPNDSVVIDENQNEVVLAEWKGTMVRAKKGSYPVDEKDGQLILDNQARNKYKDTPFVFDNLTDGDNWYFMAFPYTENDVFTIDSSNRDTATAVIKVSQPAPSAPTISNLEFDRVAVRGASGTEVRLDNGSWFDSPHTFTGLTEETAYKAYARMKETATKLPSPASSPKSFTTPSELPLDNTNSPGPKVGVGGDMDAGYFGTVPASELFTGSEIASAVGITQGTAQYNDTGWLKFAIDGKIIYKSQKPYRYGISWDHIDSKGAVFGTKEVTKSGTRYKVRLMKTGTTDPMSGYGGNALFGSEWNRLMYPIHEYAETDSGWYSDDNVEKPTPYWGINFTNADLGLIDIDGRHHWCQETYSSNRLYRGHMGVSYSGDVSPSLMSSNWGWSPVLEVTE